MRWLKYHFGKGLLLLAFVAVCAIFAKPVVGCLVQVVLWWMEHWPHELNYYVLGWGCVIGLVILINIGKEVWGRLLRGSQVDACNEDFQGENPIRCFEEDILHRKPFVSMLYELLTNVPRDAGACCVGLCAKWGEGKTSVINLLREYNAKDENPKLLFLDFSPWKYSDHNDFPFRFFLQIADEVGRKGSGMRREAAAFKTLARALRLKYAERRMGTLGAAVDVVREWWSSTFYGEDDLREELVVCMKRSRKRIVVVIDDLDRLPNEDIQKFVTFIKAHADLSGLIFLIAADEERLAEAVGAIVPSEGGTQKESGRRYLEKIIPITRTLPMINGDELLGMLEKEVDQLINKSLPGNVNRKNVNLKICIPYLQDVRHLKRMLNAISIDLAFAKRMADANSFFGFDIGDYIAVSVLREFERDFYMAIPQVRQLLDSKVSLFEVDSSGVDDAWMNEHLYKYATADGMDVCRWFVTERMGLSVKANAGKTLYAVRYQDLPEDILDRRFAARQYFPCYYFVETEGIPISQSDLNEFNSCIKEKKYPSEVIDRMDSNNALPYLLYALEDIPVHEDFEVALFYVRTLAKISERTLRPAVLSESIRSGDMVTLNVYERIFRALFRYVSQIRTLITSGNMRLRLHRTDQHVGDALLPILEEEHAGYLMGEFIRIESSYHKADAADFDCLFSHEQYSALETKFIALVSERQADNYVTNHLACFDLLRCWMITIRKYDCDDWRKKFAAVNDHCLDDYAALSKILIFFSDDQRAGQDDALAFAVDVGLLKLYWTGEQIDRIEKTLETFLKRDEKDVLFLRCLKFVRCQMQVGGDFSSKAQMEYLHSERNSALVLNPTSKAGGS